MQTFVKRRDDAPEDYFAAESAGLAAIAATGAIGTPRVVEVARDRLVLEDLGRGRPGNDFWHRAGASLAAMHAHRGHAFGFAHDGYCGRTPQSNARDADGHRFFARHRLRALADRLVARGAMRADDRDAVERIADRLPSYVPPMPAVLVHGDLWLGNLHCCGDGSPALIDAGAVHCGWAEADLAMLTLFGAPPADFFDAYADAGTLSRDWRERAPLYNLYHLMNHWLLFGAGYADATRAVLRRFG